MAFEEARTLAKLARVRGRDLSVVSRQLQAIAKKAPVLEKARGRWVLTALGQQFAQWGHAAHAAQQAILQQRSRLRLAATREFSARVLIPHLRSLLGDDWERLTVQVKTHDDGVEATLLQGEADLGFDCGRPESPSVRFRRVGREPLCVVASPKLLKHHRVRAPEDLLASPHLHYARLPAVRVLKLEHELPEVVAIFSDIASARAACVTGLGWAVLPTYTVRDELSAGVLQAIEWRGVEHELFGVLWVRGSALGETWGPRGASWLGRQRLD
ncbi:MAG: LysR family transcriptional regulator [Myxococcaceae bacterium]